MINFGRGQHSNIYLDGDNSLLKDVNSTWLIYLRWFALLNEFIWICVANGGVGIVQLAVAFSVFPTIILLIYENVVYHFLRKDDVFLNGLGWSVTRGVVILFGTVSTFIWFGEPNELLLSSIWIVLAVYTFMEMMISCAHNDKCPTACTRGNYYQI